MGDAAPASRAERLILTALAQYPGGRSKTQVALLAGYAHSGGGFLNAISALRSKGFIEGQSDLLRITTVGSMSIGPVDPLPTGNALFEKWCQELSKAEREILEVLRDAHSAPMTKTDIAERTPSRYIPTGGGFLNALLKTSDSWSYRWDGSYGNQRRVTMTIKSQMDDQTWYAAEDLEAAKTEYIKDSGVLDFNGYTPHEVAPDFMDTKCKDETGEDIGTAAEILKQMIFDGQEFPVFFLGEE